MSAPRVIPPCACCGLDEGTRLFSITINGEPLRASLWLCATHGETFLLRIGYAVGEFLQDHGADWP